MKERESRGKGSGFESQFKEGTLKSVPGNRGGHLPSPRMAMWDTGRSMGNRRSKALTERWAGRKTNRGKKLLVNSNMAGRRG